MINISFPANRPDIAEAIGIALVAIGEGGGHGNLPSQGPVWLGRLEQWDLDVYDNTPLTAEQHDALPLEVQLKHLTTTIDENVDAGVDDTKKQTPGADSAAGPGTTSETGTSDSAGAPTSDGPMDLKGVTRLDKFCANALKPFYASGKRSGQWKRAQGVTEAEYDAWYAAELEQVATVTNESDGTVDGSAAFDNDGSTGNQAAATAPQNFGELITWISEMQAAKHLGQADVDAAYATTGVVMADLYTGEAGVIAQKIAAVHGFLAAKVPQ